MDKGEIDTIEKILETKELSSDSWKWLLQRAIGQGNQESLVLFLQQGVDLNDYEYNLLNFACRVENLSIVKLLIDAGAEVNDPGSPIFFSTIENDSVQIAEYLLKEGAALSLPNYKGETVIHEAAREQSPGI